MEKLQLISDDNEFMESDCCSAQLLSLSDCINRGLLISPDTQEKLVFQTDHNKLSDGDHTFDILNGSPVLYPKEIIDHLSDGKLPFKNYSSSILQYYLLSQIKQTGEINAPFHSSAARKHQFRFHDFCKKLTGRALDIGSDKPSHSARLLPRNCEYLGLDPYAGDGEFRIIGLGEILPIKNSSFDVVLFNTSLDHILDYHTAIEEAYRVLTENGRLVIATYVWIKFATLLADTVHFHHFREFEIFGALHGKFTIEDLRRYEDPKNADHRYGLYVMARKH